MLDRETSMGWPFRKSYRILPGARINLTKGGPRLSVGVHGARASIGMEGKTKLYKRMCPVRYHKTLTTESSRDPVRKDGGFLGFIKGM